MGLQQEPCLQKGDSNKRAQFLANWKLCFTSEWKCPSRGEWEDWNIDILRSRWFLFSMGFHKLQANILCFFYISSLPPQEPDEEREKKKKEKLLAAVALFRHFTRWQRSPKVFKSAARWLPLWIHLCFVPEPGWTLESIATTWQNFALSTDPQPTTSCQYNKVWHLTRHIKGLGHKFKSVLLSEMALHAPSQEAEWFSKTKYRAYCPSTM